MAEKYINEIAEEELRIYCEEVRKINLRRRGIYIPPEEKLRYVLYARRSTKSSPKERLDKATSREERKKLDKQERSIPDQISECLKLAQKEELQVVLIVQEEGSAYAKDNRKKFDKMINDIKIGKYDGIIAYAPDRLARNMKEAGEMLDMVEEGVIKDLKFPTFHFERETNSMLSLGLNFLLAENYSTNLSYHTKKANEGIIKEGKGIRNSKLGYILNKDRYFRPDPDNFEKVKTLFNLGLEGRTLIDIVDISKRLAITFNGKLRVFTTQNLSSLLRDPFYAGKHLNGTQIIDLKAIDKDFTPMITALDFTTIRRHYDKLSSRRKSKTKEPLFFTGRVICNNCAKLCSAGKSTSGSGHKYLWVNCTNKECKHKVRIRGTDLLKYSGKILTNLSKRITKEDFDKFVSQVKKEQPERLDRLQYKHISLSQEINEKKEEISAKEKQNMRKDLSLETKKLINIEISKLYSELNKLNSEREEIKNDLLILKVNLGTELESLEKFSTFLKEADNTIKTSHNKYKVDKIIKMAFSTYVVEGKDIVAYKLKSPLEGYKNLDSFLNGVEDGT
ncbi:MAG TPA: recombinase family protein [Candidatus Dojkabacteria bacterium]|nr:recombinase family protein [Candidatus Dojkabacteria bacterium]